MDTVVGDANFKISAVLWKTKVYCPHFVRNVNLNDAVQNFVLTAYVNILNN